MEVFYVHQIKYNLFFSPQLLNHEYLRLCNVNEDLFQPLHLSRPLNLYAGIADFVGNFDFE